MPVPIIRGRVRPRAGNDHVEHEMTPPQIGLVDSCFEEAHYESGIAVLDQLRVPKFRPTPSHIRQLLYIALYTPAPVTGKRKEKATPSRNISGKQVASTPISQSAITMAQQCLSAFALTNSPDSLMQALPRYPSLGEHDLTDQNMFEQNEDLDRDSYVAEQAASLKDYKDCWRILKEDSLQHAQDEGMGMFTGSPSKRRRMRSHTRIHRQDDDPPLPIGPNSWPVLNWLVRLFEKDEERMERSGQPRYSPLLLSQIPPIRSEAGAKWAADAPLDAVFHCLIQDNFRKRSMGTQLLTLLINLTSTTLFDLPLFLNLVLTRFPIDSCAFKNLFPSLPSSTTIIKFKIFLYQKYLLGASTIGRPLTPRTRTRAHPRPVPNRACRKPGELAQKGPITRTESIESLAQADVAGTLISSRHALPSATEILNLLTSSPDIEAHSIAAKCELLTNYESLQSQAVESEGSKEWSAMLRDGRLEQAVRDVFGSQNAGGDDERLAHVLRDELLSVMTR
ncbi:hypothetical protein EW146_g1306 [Bondarzewia mesenterica]|uniref:Uncharacterized protein n=1 Tax=Bondarzewia mesenterica TaxID=1095465 RepID=A0A4S4M4A5_9AGAM|nr:hypothetical protein EW146_g1306 [Bondarzewia mesenterica]